MTVDIEHEFMTNSDRLLGTIISSDRKINVASLIWLFKRSSVDRPLDATLSFYPASMSTSDTLPPDGCTCSIWRREAAASPDS